MASIIYTLKILSDIPTGTEFFREMNLGIVVSKIHFLLDQFGKFKFRHHLWEAAPILLLGARDSLLRGVCPPSKPNILCAARSIFALHSAF